MKFKVHKDKSSSDKSTMYVRTSEIEEGVVVELHNADGLDIQRGILFILRPGMLVERVPNVNPCLGFPLDDKGRVKVI